MSYVSRYLAGEYEQVWRELFSAPQTEIQQEPLYSDALGVAREMMSRVRQNLLMLIERLELLGYQFGYGWVQSDDKDIREWAEWTKRQYPVLLPPLPDIQEQLATLEQQGTFLPLAVRAWYEVVGAVNFVGVPPKEWESFIHSTSSGDVTALDPFCVHPFDHALEEDRLSPADEAFAGESDWSQDGSKVKLYKLCIAPDEYFKYFQSGAGPYVIQLPHHPTPDGFIDRAWFQMWFVDYLRLTFSWGGFPGMGRLPKRPEKDIAYLTADFLPF